MAAPMYFWHLLDIIRSKVGEPLLHELARQDEKLAHHLDPANENSSQVQFCTDCNNCRKNSLPPCATAFSL